MGDLMRREPAAIQRRSRTQDRGPLTEYLVFILAGEPYAVPVSLVREILKPPPITPVPRAPNAIIGIISVRGQLVTVVDLRARLRLPAPPPTRRSRILLADATGETLGLHVDEVSRVQRLADSEIEPAASALGGEVTPHIAGIARPGTRPLEPSAESADGSVIILLDLRAALI